MLKLKPTQAVDKNYKWIVFDSFTKLYLIAHFTSTWNIGLIKKLALQYSYLYKSTFLVLSCCSKQVKHTLSIIITHCMNGKLMEEQCWYLRFWKCKWFLWYSKQVCLIIAIREVWTTSKRNIFKWSWKWCVCYHKL